MLGDNLKTAAAGVRAGGDPVYVDDLFSTYLYDGNGTTQTITHGIDITGEGGLTWIKRRNGTSDHNLFDTERGFSSTQSNMLNSNQFSPQLSMSSYVNATTNGFVLNHSGGDTNDSNSKYVSWNFRKAPGFFDVVTYVGTGSNQDISHDLGSVPGMIIVKNLDINAHWTVYHRELGSGKYLLLNDPDSAANDTTGVYWGNTAPTSSVFTVGSTGRTNGLDDDGNGYNYVAYIFAHDDQSFGDNNNEAIIKCGSYTGTGSAGNQITLGFEPQWLLVKNISQAQAQDWEMFDNMRGVSTDGHAVELFPNLGSQERSAFNIFNFNATGFETESTLDETNASGEDFIYVAIRRPHKPPEAGSDVFGISGNFTGGYGGSDRHITTGGVTPDVILSQTTTSAMCGVWTDRLRGGDSMGMSGNQGDKDSYWSLGDWYDLDVMDGYKIGGTSYTYSNASGQDYISYAFKRAPGFFDAVVYTGAGSNTTSQTHNLGVKPELKIIKSMDGTGGWIVGGWTGDRSKYLRLDNSDAEDTNSTYWDAADTAATFSVRAGNSNTSANGTNYLCYLFASQSGVSKVGTYSGSSGAVNVNCGFTNGARFVLIKRLDSADNWMMFDTIRGISSGNDPYLRLNLASAQITSYDRIDPLSSGFTVNSGDGAINISGGSYLFLAIA